MPETLDTRCSEACTRAGAFALLLSAIAISLLGPLIAANTRTALQKYINFRLALKEQVDQTSADPCWQILSEQLGGMNLTKALSLTELGKIECKEQFSPDGTDPELSKGFSNHSKAPHLFTVGPPGTAKRERAPT
jgi:hypothetical protein